MRLPFSAWSLCFCSAPKFMGVGAGSEFPESGFQPSELAKVAVVLVLARYLGGQHEDYLSKTRILILTGLTLCPALLVVMQGDLGTALTYFPILMGTMFVAGLRLRLVLQALTLSLLSAPFAWFALKDYQQQRILVTLNPSLDPQGVRLSDEPVHHCSRLLRAYRKGIRPGASRASWVLYPRFTQTLCTRS